MRAAKEVQGLISDVSRQVPEEQNSRLTVFLTEEGPSEKQPRASAPSALDHVPVAHRGPSDLRAVCV